NAALFKDPLHLPVFTKRSVKSNKGELDLVRQIEVWTSHIDFCDLRAERPQGLGNPRAGGERNLPLRSRAALENCNLLPLQIDHRVTQFLPRFALRSPIRSRVVPAPSP